jgi:hypothetical protein
MLLCVKLLPGMRVVAVARRRDRLEQLQQHMLSSAVGVAPVDFLPVVCDITKEPEVAALPRWGWFVLMCTWYCVTDIIGMCATSLRHHSAPTVKGYARMVVLGKIICALPPALTV